MKNVIKFLQSRRSITAKNMICNEVNEDDLDDILKCGIRVPDHGALNPWELIVINGNAKLRLGNDILAKEYQLINPEASVDDINYERSRLCRAALLLLFYLNQFHILKYLFGRCNCHLALFVLTFLLRLNLLDMLLNG